MPSKMHAVETLLEHRPIARYKNGSKKSKSPGEHEYLVRWAGADPATGAPWADTWEPTENIDPVTLEAYYTAQLARRPPPRSKGARVAKPPFRWPDAEAAPADNDTDTTGPPAPPSTPRAVGHGVQTAPRPLKNRGHASSADGAAATAAATKSSPFGSSPPLPYSWRVPEERSGGNVASSPPHTPPKKRRRICDILKDQSRELEGKFGP